MDTGKTLLLAALLSVCFLNPALAGKGPVASTNSVQKNTGSEGGADLAPLAGELTGSSTVILEFGADWCAPCLRLHPEMQSYAASRNDVQLINIDIDREEGLATYYDVWVLPTVMVFQDGELLERFRAGQEPAEVLARIDALVGE